MNDTDAPQDDIQQSDGRQDGRLIGRDSEFDRVRAFLASARIDGGTLLVTGEPGFGKTVLLDAASDEASAAGMRIIRAGGVEFEAGLSFSGLNQVLLPLLDGLPKLPAVHRDALNVALGFGEGTPPDRLVVSNAALALVRQAATSRPLLLVIDDLPWLDRASAGVLSFVARRIEGSSVGLLGASRSEEVAFFDYAGLPELEIQRLDERASRQLLEVRFPELAPSVRERVLSEAQGNPLALLELPVALRGEMRASAQALPSALPLTRRLQALFASRIDRLPPRTRQLLLRMALDGTGDVRVLEARPTSNAGFRELAAAEEARLAYFDSATHRLAFQHPLIRSAVVDLSLAEERRAAHRVLADLWADQPDRRVWHLAEANIEPDESVASQLEAAAARALARGDAVGCVKALTRSAELSPLDADRRRRLSAAAYVGADVAGDLSNASRVLTELRRGHADLEGSLPAAIAAASFLLWADGDVATAHRLLVGAIEVREGVLDASDPVQAEALNSLLMVCTWGANEELWRPFKEAMARTEGVPAVLYLNSKIFADPARADPTALAALDSAIAALADESDPTLITRIGMSATHVGRLEGCRDALTRVVEDARRGGAVASGILALVELAMADFEIGRWDESEQMTEEAIRYCESHGYETMIRPSRYVQALVAAARGDYARAHELSDELVQWAGPRGMRAYLSGAAHVRALVALGQGDFEEAYQQAAMISPAGFFRPHVPYALRVVMVVVESAVRTGRVAEAAAHVAVMQDMSIASLSSRLALMVGGSCAMIARDEDAVSLFEAALALPGVDRWQFDLARVRLAYGERLRRSREMIEARVQLNAAREIFMRLRAQPWVERASAELRATGQTKPRSGGSNGLDQLTPQEFEVATLAARGLTNKQIAERMFLSHRTVGGHLDRAFPKLGVATRAALRDALDSRPPDRPATPLGRA